MLESFRFSFAALTAGKSSRPASASPPPPPRAFLNQSRRFSNFGVSVVERLSPSPRAARSLFLVLSTEILHSCSFSMTQRSADCPLHTRCFRLHRTQNVVD